MSKMSSDSSWYLAAHLFLFTASYEDFYWRKYAKYNSSCRNWKDWFGLKLWPFEFRRRKQRQPSVRSIRSSILSFQAVPLVVQSWFEKNWDKSCQPSMALEHRPFCSATVALCSKLFCTAITSATWGRRFCFESLPTSSTGEWCLTQCLSPNDAVYILHRF